MRSTAARDRATIRLPDLGVFRSSARLTRPSTTLEVRWIHRGSLPEAMIGWLGPFGNRIERREDRYLVDPVASDLGVKIRDAVQLDLKAFRGSRGELRVPGTVRGRLELWEKWSFPLPARALPPADAAGWLTLEKIRRRRSFRVDDHEMVERPVDEAELPGCAIELTEVVLGQGRWWTLGLEATGDPETLGRNLDAAVARLFREPSPDPKLLDLRHSMSYPRWLTGDPRVDRGRRSRSERTRVTSPTSRAG